MLKACTLLLALWLLGPALGQAHPVIYKGGWVLWSELQPRTNTQRISYSFHPHWALELSSSYARPYDEPRVEVYDYSLGLNILLKRWYLQDSQANIYAGAGGGLSVDAESYRVPYSEGIQDKVRVQNGIAFYNRRLYRGQWYAFLEGDWESRRWYTALKISARQRLASPQQLGLPHDIQPVASNIVHNQGVERAASSYETWFSNVMDLSLRYRLGMAPYVGGMDELQTWLIVQLDARPPYYYRSEAEPLDLVAARSYALPPNLLEVTPLMRFFYKNVLWEMGASIRGQFFTSLMLHY